MAIKEGLFERLHEVNDLGSGFGREGGGDGQVVGTIAAEVFDGITFLDEDIEAAAGVALILGEDARELGQGAGAGVAQGDEGFFFARGEIWQGEDGLFLEEGTEVGVAFPLLGVDQCGVKGGDWIPAFFQTALDTDG